jgi:hypothetical protein
MSTIPAITFTDTTEADESLQNAKKELKAAQKALDEVQEALNEARDAVDVAAAKRNEAVIFYSSAVRDFLAKDMDSVMPESDDDDWEPDPADDFCQICGGPNH